MTANLVDDKTTASLLGVSVATLRRWRCCGRGPRFIKLSRAVRYDPAELRAYIERSTRRSTRDEVPR